MQSCLIVWVFPTCCNAAAQSTNKKSNFLTSEVQSILDQLILGCKNKHMHVCTSTYTLAYLLTSIYDVWEFVTEHFYHFLIYLCSPPEASFLLGTTSQDEDSVCVCVCVFLLAQ